MSLGLERRLGDATSWLFFCVARSTVMIQIAALRSRLEKQPTDLRRNPRDLGDGALVHRPRNSMYFGWILCVSLLLAASAPGGERTALQSSPGTEANNGGTPLWSFDLD